MRVKSIFRFAAAAVLAMALVPAYAQPAAPDVRDLQEPTSEIPTLDLVGSWVLAVDSTATPDFSALQTFHLGGTVDETSDLLAGLGEGPGHGAWKQTGIGHYSVTFELFIFNPDRTPAGRIRVRESLRVVNENTLKGYAVADLILPDGTIIENIDNGPMTGTRVPLEAVRPEEIGSAPIATTRMPARRAW